MMRVHSSAMVLMQVRFSSITDDLREPALQQVVNAGVGFVHGGMKDDDWEMCDPALPRRDPPSPCVPIGLMLEDARKVSHGYHYGNRDL